MIQNPILPGFHPDPCICRRGEDYYLVVSSFEWMPGLPVYHSRDLKHWELYTHILTDDQLVDLKKLPSAKGIWAPCLTYCQAEDTFYLVYGLMNSMNARYFDVDNFVIKAKGIRGPWSQPVYLHSAGFDASLFHDADGRKYLLSLEWETREGYEHPGPICMVEYDDKKQEIVGLPKPIWRGGTERGCLEAPHLYKRGDYYYIMCAEGGTGYNHCVAIGRSKELWGPYTAYPMNPIVTSQPYESHERNNPDHLKPKYYNPKSLLQKSGHGSLIETQTGETYLVHLCARPILPELRCILGRETAIQKMAWTEDGWLRMMYGGNLAREEVEESNLPECQFLVLPARDDFDQQKLRIDYYAPRQLPERFTDLTARPGWVRLTGCESAASLNRTSFLARKVTSLDGFITTKMEFMPQVYQQSAGLMLYYDNMNFLYLRKYYSETLDQSALSIIYVENGSKHEYLDTRTPVSEEAIYLKLEIHGRDCFFSWCYDGEHYERIGQIFDTSKFSDEYSEYGEFTGTMVGIACEDRLTHKAYADFDFLDVRL